MTQPHTATAQVMRPSDALLREYMRAPVLAVPTVVLFVAMMSGIAATWYHALTGHIALWQGAIVNGLLSYGLFSVIHDGAHRAISRNRWVNWFVGDTALLFLFPYAPMVALRWIHNQHHIDANGPSDPDRFEHDGPKWQAPLRWLLFDANYILYFFTRGIDVARRHARALIAYYTFLLAALAGVIHAGYGWELFWLWFIPTRIALFLIAVVFVILPHYPAVVSHERNPYMATTMRMGWEWLLTPLLAYQNYHLIHHLYPTVPFYRMHKVWYLKYDELNRHDIAFQKAFELTPANIGAQRALLADAGEGAAQAA